MLCGYCRRSVLRLSPENPPIILVRALACFDDTIRLHRLVLMLCLLLVLLLILMLSLLLPSRDVPYINIE